MTTKLSEIGHPSVNQELKLRKVIWLLLRQIGKPVTINPVSLLGVPGDARLVEQRQPGSEDVTISAE